MKKKKIIATISVVIFCLLAAGATLQVTVQSFYREAEQEKSFRDIHSTYGFTRIYVDTENRTYPFLMRQTASVPVAVWGKALTGSARLSILDAQNKVIRDWQGRNIHAAEEIQLPRGRYSIQLTFTHYSGSFRFGANEFLFNVDLPPERYQQVEANPSAGFHWDYLLYIPKTIQHPYLLVVPNNSGFVEDDMLFHTESAKNTIQGMSSLADALGTPLLVPVFPRPAGELEEFYTHNLDRDVLLTNLPGYQRIDLQLLAMVEDARSKLAEQQIQLSARFLMWGFSASGAFSDRFSLQHPDRLVAVAAGGCNNSLPFATYAGENLLYPIGTYDYAAITGEPFDAEAFAALPRFLYKGDQDAGGTMTTDSGVYPANEYFDRFIRAGLEDRLKSAPVPLISGPEMSHADEDFIRYRIYQRAVFVDEFRAASKIYAEAGLRNSQFKLYNGVGYDITDEMKADVLAFFKANLQ